MGCFLIELAASVIILKVPLENVKQASALADPTYFLTSSHSPPSFSSLPPL